MLRYVIGDTEKRPRQFQIGFLTVFMVVAFSSLMLVFLNGSHAVFFRVGQANGGDFDFTITALPESQQYTKGRDNFFSEV